MKKVFLVVLILILFFVILNYINSNPKMIISKFLNEEGIGKRGLIYRIYLFGVIPVGEASLGMAKLEWYKGQRVYHLSAEAKSLKILSPLFSGQAFLDSYIDTKELWPILFKEEVRVKGGRGFEREITYEQKEGIMTVANVRRKIPPNTQDPLSTLYNIRRMNFDNRGDFEININTHQKNYILRGLAVIKSLWINRKPYKIILTKAKIRRRDKNPYHQSSITMFLLKREENIPILIKVFASGVLINAKLVRIK